MPDVSFQALFYHYRLALLVSFFLANLPIIVVLLASLATWVWMKARWENGDSPFAFRQRTSLEFDPLIVFAVLAIWVGTQMLAILVLPATLPEPLHPVKVSCLSGMLTIAGIMMVLLRSGHRPQELGISLQHWKTDLRDGAVGYLAAFLPVFVVLLATFFFRSEETMHTFLQLLRKHPQASTILWLIVAVVVIAPLTEELLFRVVLQGAFTSRFGPRFAIPLVAIAFSAVHGWPDLLPLIPLALVLGYVYHQRHSFLAVVVLHAIFNATNLVFALLTAELAAGR